MPLLLCVLVMTPQLFPSVIPLLELLAALGEILRVQLLSSTARKVTLRKSVPVIFVFSPVISCQGVGVFHVYHSKHAGNPGKRK